MSELQKILARRRSMIPDELLPTGESESSPTALAVPAVPVPTLQKSEVHRFIKPSPITAATQPSLSLISTHLPVSTLSAAVESEKEPAPVIDTEQPQSPKHVSVFAPVLASDPVPFQEKVLVEVVVEEEMVVVGVEEKEEKEEKKVVVEEKEVEVPVVRLEWSVSQEPVLGAGVAVAVVADESCSPSLDRKHALVGSEEEDDDEYMPTHTPPPSSSGSRAASAIAPSMDLSARDRDRESSSSVNENVPASGKGDLYRNIDLLLENQDDFLGDLDDDLEILFEREVSPRVSPRAASSDEDGISDFRMPYLTVVENRTETGAKTETVTDDVGTEEHISHRMKKSNNLFDDDGCSGDEENGAGFLTSVSTPSAAACRSAGNSKSQSGRFSVGFSRNSRFSSGGGSAHSACSSNFESPEYIRGFFHELVTEAMPSSLEMDSTMNDSGFFDGGGYGAGPDKGLKDLDFLLGSASSKVIYAPGVLGLSEEAYESNMYKRDSYSKKTQDADTMAAALLGEDFEDEGSSFTAVASPPVPKPKPASSTASGSVSLNGPTGKKKMDASMSEMDYDDFQHRMSIPACKDLRDVIAKFLWSVAGPSECGTTPSSMKDAPAPDYVFYGTKNLVNRCRDFFDAMDTHMRKHPRWSHEPDEKFSSIRDCLEQHCMLKISDIAYAASVEEGSKEDDIAVLRKVRCIQFLQPGALDINPVLHHERIWNIAGAELAKINSPSANTPGAKNACIVKCAAVIFRALSIASQKLSNGKEDGSTCGADDFLPLFIWVVLRAQVPNLFAHCDYIEAFLNPARLMGKDGYCLMNLRSALIFIKELSADSVTMDAEMFNRLFADEQIKLAESE